MYKFRYLILIALLLTGLLLACGSTEIAPYNPAKDPIVKEFKIGDEGKYEVRRIQCLFADEGYEGSAAIYLTYTWTLPSPEPAECVETYSGLPIKSADILMLGLTDLVPEEIFFNATMLYSNGKSSALNEQTFSQELNSIPPECPINNSGLPLVDCTVKISIKSP